MENCVNHPTVAAEWVCPECDQGYCPSCISRRETGAYKKQTKFYCPKCNVEAQWMGVDNLLPPFWNRLHKFFVYPFRTQPLIFNLVLSALYLLLHNVPILGFLASIALYGVMIKYAFAAMRATARGRLIPPKVDLPALTEDFGEAFKQIIILAILGVILAMVANFFGLGGAILAGMSIVAFLPAIIIVQVMTGSVIHALNPMMFAPIAWRIGFGYVAMCFYLLLLLGAPYAAQGFIVAHTPEMVQTFLLSFVSNYYTIMTYHLLGYVLLQYHLELGYEVNYDDFQTDAPKDPSQAAAPQLSGDAQYAEQLIMEGKLDQALEFLRKRFKTQAITESTLTEKYLKLLQMKDLNDEWLKVSGLHLRLALQDGKRNEVRDCFEECLRLNPEFLAPADVLFKLGELYEEKGQFKEAMQAYNTLVKKHKDHTLVPETYFRAAQIYHDRLTLPDKAKKILKALVAKYPNHEIRPRVDQYLRMII